MTIDLGEHRGAPLIAPSGDIDMDSSPDLRKVLMTLVKEKATPLLIDCTRVTYIDSS